MTNIQETYKLWYSIWNIDYIPLIAQREKWHAEIENLIENDIIYFKLKDSKLAQSWLIGKVEFVNTSKDGKIRTVGVSYKHDTEDGERKFSIVERPVRECIKLFNIEDTSLLDDIRSVQKASQELLDDNKIVTQEEVDRAFDDNLTPETDEPQDEILMSDDEEKESLQSDEIEVPKKQRKKKKTELENLEIENWESPLTEKRIRKKIFNCVNSNSPAIYESSIIGLQLMTKEEYKMDMNRLLGEEGIEMNEQNPVMLL